jgi:hypothetical protein
MAYRHLTHQRLGRQCDNESWLLLWLKFPGAFNSKELVAADSARNVTSSSVAWVESCATHDVVIERKNVCSYE